MSRRGTCRACGCTDDRACIAGGRACWWTDMGHTLCSACLEAAPGLKPVESAAFMALQKRVIGDDPELGPYLTRRIILQTPLFSVYVHEMHRSDYDRALHDHPWPFLSLVLRPYSEIWWAEKFTPIRWGRDAWERQADGTDSYRNGVHKKTTHKRFDILVRKAGHRHRVIIADRTKPGLTLVLTGPRVRRWGFWPLIDGAFKWCHWKNFDEKKGICESAPIPGKGGLD